MTIASGGSGDHGFEENPDRLASRAGQIYRLPMKIFLYIVAAIGFIGPIVVWAYFVALAGMYNTSSPNRFPNLSDYLSMEFLILAAVPWLISAVSLFFAWKMQ